jgi:hypothetical protein
MVWPNKGKMIIAMISFAQLKYYPKQKLHKLVNWQISKQKEMQERSKQWISAFCFGLTIHSSYFVIKLWDTIFLNKMWVQIILSNFSEQDVSTNWTTESMVLKCYQQSQLAS